MLIYCRWCWANINAMYAEHIVFQSVLWLMTPIISSTETTNLEPMVVWCGAYVADVVATVSQPWFNNDNRFVNKPSIIHHVTVQVDPDIDQSQAAA